MKKTVLTVICIIALFINAYFGYFGYVEDVADDENGDENGGGDDDDDGNGNGGNDDDDDGPGPQATDEVIVNIRSGESRSVDTENLSLKIKVLSITGSKVNLEVDPGSHEATAAEGSESKIMLSGDHYVLIKVLSIEGDTVSLRVSEFEKFSVHQPPEMIGDEYTYDFGMYVEVYNQNLTSGEYTKYTMSSDGSWVSMVEGPFDVETGYGDKHPSIMNRYILNGEFEITVETESTGEITVNGDFEADDKEYTELMEKKNIKSDKTGMMGVDSLPNSNIGGPVSYSGKMRYYPDPKVDQDPTISQRIYGDKTITEGDTGSVYFEGATEQSSSYYNWTAIGQEVLRVQGQDIPTLLMNISSHNSDMTTQLSEGFVDKNLYYEFDFKRSVWLSNENSHIIREIFHTNTSYENEEEISWFVFEETRDLLSFSAGDTEIPWDPSGTPDYPDRHPTGEYLEWDMVPAGGYLFPPDAEPEDLTVQMDPEAAFEFGLENNDDLNDYLGQYPNAFVTWAKYNTSLQTPQLNDKTGSHRWNFSLEDPMSDDLALSYKEKNGNWPMRHYQFRVAKNLTINKNPLDPKQYDHTIEIDDDMGMERGWTNIGRSELDSRGLTLSGAHDIIKADPDAGAQLFDSSGNLILEDLAIHVGKIAGAEEAPGAEIIEALTGLYVPYTKYTWSFQRASLKEMGDTFIISVDVDTGRVVQITQLEGNQLLAIFE